MTTANKTATKKPLKKVVSYPALALLVVRTDLESELVREIIETVNL